VIVLRWVAHQENRAEQDNVATFRRKVSATETSAHN